MLLSSQSISTLLLNSRRQGRCSTGAGVTAATAAAAAAAPPSRSGHTCCNRQRSPLHLGHLFLTPFHPAGHGTVCHRHSRRCIAAVASAATEPAGTGVENAAAAELSAAAATADLSSDLSVDEPPSFSDLGIDPLLVSGLSASGIDTPSPIQEAAIPVLLSGSNAAIQSYTGSGKTLAFLLPSLTLALQRAEAAFKRRQAVLQDSSSSSSRRRGRVALQEEDLWTVQVLVVAPSQELALQIGRVAADLFPQGSRSAVQVAIGGANMRRQAEAITEHQPLMVVGTPGRLVDLVGLGVLRLHRCPLLILDEADQLLGDVYAQHVNTLMQHCGRRLGSSSSGGGGRSSGSSGGGRSSSSSSSSSNGIGSSGSNVQSGSKPAQQDELLQPSRRQTVLVSATLWSGGLARFESWCPKPQFVTMGASPTWSDEFEGQGSGGPEEPAKTWGWGAKGWEGPASVVRAGPKTQGSAGGPEGQGLVPTLPTQLEHMYIVVNPDRKSDVLRRAVHALNINMGLGFMNWQQRLKDMAAKLAAKKIEVAALHGELQAGERGAIFDAARKGAYRLLLVSDLAARGLDLPQVDAVFNLELPSSAAHYAHRAGRTGRMGAPGLVVTLVAPGERFVVERLSKRLGVPIMECHLAAGQLVMGPMPQKDRKPRKAVQAADAAAAAAAADTADTSPAQQQQQQQQRGAKSPTTKQQQQQVPQASSGPPAAAAGLDKGITLDPEAAAFDPDEGDSSGANDESLGVFLLDEADDVEVEGDEPIETYRQRLRSELDAELAEIRAERRQRREQQPEAGGGGGRRVRQRSRAGSAPRGTPQEAAALAMAAIEADEASRKARARLPQELLGASSSSGGSSGGGGSGSGSSSSSSGARGGRKPRAAGKASKLRLP